MEEYRKDPDWFKKDKAPCDKCCAAGMCMDSNCEDFEKWKAFRTEKKNVRKNG